MATSPERQSAKDRSGENPAQDAQQGSAHAGIERELAELRAYRAAFDHHAIVAVTDRSGRITLVNDLFCMISKYSRSELIGQNHRILNSSHHPKRFWVEAWRTIAHGKVWHGEVCNRAKDGTLYWVDTTIVPIADDAGRIVQYVAIRADITSRKHAEEALRKAKNAADAANNAKSEFLANMSHEIRTPMTAILGYAGLLSEALTDPARQLEYIETIRRNGEHLLSIINDILDIAKIEAGKLAIETIEAGPIKILEDVLSFKQVRLLGRNLVVRTRQKTPIPATVHTDPTRLKQILMNLVGNAIKFTDHGYITVSVAYEEDGPHRGHLCFEVQDTGVGMSPDQLQRLFGAFEQADASTTRKYGGTGLGLRISRRLAQMLGGDISVQSELGRGSTFALRIRADRPSGTVMVSVLDPQIVQALDEAPGTPTTQVAQAGLVGARILLAEDGVDNQRLITQFLTKAGAEVHIVANGRLAVEALTVDGTFDGVLADPAPFDLLLTDMQMPELDGYATAVLLRQRGSRLRVVALTAHAMDGDGERCIAAGCDAYATKPIDRRALVELCAGQVRIARGAEPEVEPLVSEYASDPDYAPLIDEFITAFPQRLAEIRLHVDAVEVEKAAVLVHQLKGAGGSYGFAEVTEAARRLESALRAGEPGAQLREHLEALALLARRMVARHLTEDLPVPQPVSTVLPVAGQTGELTITGVSLSVARLRVLVIDDASDIHDLLRHELQALELEIETASTGSEGLARIVSRHPDLVLLDLGLPDMSGLDLLNTLRGMPGCSAIPVIVLTGSDDEQTSLRAFEDGANDYVHKPFRGPVLRARVQTALRTQALMRDLEQQASRDPLTGLYNREALFARLTDALRRDVGTGVPSGAVLYLDFDRFKLLNDMYGHEAGDELLRRVAARLSRVVEKERRLRGIERPATVARVGGDEFVVVVEGITQAGTVEQLSRKLLLALSADIELGTHHVVAGASIGIAHFPRGYTRTAAELVCDADAMMYEAKRAGGSRFEVFDDLQRRRLERRMLIERELHLAIVQEQLLLLYQPIVGLRSGRVEGLEALVRWDHPLEGRLSPAEFLSVAAECGLIRPLGDWVLRTACAQLVEIRRTLSDRAPEYVAVNVSRRQLTDPLLPSRVAAALTEAGLEAGRLHLEITESELVSDMQNARQVVGALKSLGVQIAIDDFGTGYSSLASLHEFPIDVIKLDRSFVSSGSRDECGGQLFAIAHAILRLAQNIGVRVVAEGVETPDQLALLNSLDCDLAQGYLLGKPMEVREVVDFCS